MNAEQVEPKSLLLMLRLAIAPLLTCITDTVLSSGQDQGQSNTPVEFIFDLFMLNVFIKMYQVQKFLRDVYCKCCEIQMKKENKE